ncbi:MOC2B synthase, partial [Fregata magnificens]|nr:MOC2B synthase [Fregata magnificens]
MDESEDVPKDFIKLKSEKLSVDEVSELVISPYCGAVSLFVALKQLHWDKVVRSFPAGVAILGLNRTAALEYRTAWELFSHPLGNSFVVPITEASVIIAVSSPHRAESLEAVMYCINTLKASVPIWKKEIYEDEYSWKENKECFWANSGK